MEHQQTTDVPECAWLVWRAANGDGTAWERLVSHYEELAVAIHGASLASDDGSLRELAGHGTAHESLRAADRAQAAGNAASSLPPRWRQLLQLL